MVTRSSGIIIGISIIAIIVFVGFITSLDQMVTPLVVSSVDEILAFECASETQYVDLGLNDFYGITENKNSLAVVCVNKITNELENQPVFCTTAQVLNCDNVHTQDCSDATIISAELTEFEKGVPSCSPFFINELEFFIQKSDELIAEQEPMQPSSSWAP